jgi:hypothetical protein
MKSLRLLGLGLKLAISGGRTAVARLGLMSIGLGVGVTLLLGALSVPPALSAYDHREGVFYGTVDTEANADKATDVTLRWWLGTRFDGRQVLVIAVRGVGEAPIPVGIPSLPAAGEVFASPKLASLLSGDAGALLRPRVPGRVVGTIAPEGLLEPDQLVSYVGASPNLSIPARWEPEVVTSFAPADRGQGPPVDLGTIVLLCVTVIAVLFPIAMFILTAIRLSASTREARFAAVRLAGGTQAQVRTLAAAETAIAAVVGAVIALPLLQLARPAGNAILSAVVGHEFFPGEFAPSAPVVVVVLLIVPVFATLVAVLAMRRVVVSPLGIVRRSQRGRRGLLWPVALAGGLLGLVAAALARDAVFDLASPIPGVLIGAALLLVLIGLAGTAQWLGWLGSRAIARARPSPAMMLGARRLEAEPTSAGRVVMSVAVLIAVGAVAEGILLSTTTYDSVTPGVAALRPSEVVVQAYGNGRQNAELWRSLEPLPGVRSLAVSRMLPDGGTCSRNCVAIVQTDGRPETVERIRNAVRWLGEARTTQEVLADRTSDEPVRMVRLLELAMLLVLLVTAANLLVSTVDGMMERRRPLAVLSAIGVPNGVVRRSILFQVALPLGAALGLGASIGLAVTGLVFRIAKEPPVFPVAPLLLTTGLAAATVLLVTAASLPWIRIVRRPELLRSE